jgi:hypothetical protein
MTHFELVKLSVHIINIFLQEKSSLNFYIKLMLNFLFLLQDIFIIAWSKWSMTISWVHIIGYTSRVEVKVIKWLINRWSECMTLIQGVHLSMRILTLTVMRVMSMVVIVSRRRSCWKPIVAILLLHLMTTIGLASNLLRSIYHCVNQWFFSLMRSTMILVLVIHSQSEIRSSILAWCLVTSILGGIRSCVSLRSTGIMMFNLFSYHL